MENLLNYPLYILFGVLPSLLWLQFYLRRDVRPEPRLMILKVFALGVLSTIPAIFLEIAFFKEIKVFAFSSPVFLILNVFLGVALVEEAVKFLAVKFGVLDNPEFDEPIDAMIYMIIAALGFAAGENILILLTTGIENSVTNTFLPFFDSTFWEVIFKTSLLRFLGATFLHALSSATIGYFIGLSFFDKKKRTRLLFVGLTLAILLHGFYNFSIIKLESIKGDFKLLIPFGLLIISAIFISFGFSHLKKIDEKHRAAQIKKLSK